MRAIIKILLFALVSGLPTANCLGQARINFSNSSATPLRIGFLGEQESQTSIIGTASTARFGVGPGSMEIRLFAGLTPWSLAPVPIGSGANQEFVLNSSSGLAIAQGTFQGGSVLSLHGNYGSPIYLQFTVSGTSIGGYDVPAGFPLWARSSVILVNPTMAPEPPANPWSFTPLPNTWQGLTIYIMPEPTTGSLLLLGLLLGFQSRRQ
jgi:hypothetical protein